MPEADFTGIPLLIRANFTERISRLSSTSIATTFPAGQGELLQSFFRPPFVLAGREQVWHSGVIGGGFHPLFLDDFRGAVPRKSASVFFATVAPARGRVAVRNLLPRGTAPALRAV